MMAAEKLEDYSVTIPLLLNHENRTKAAEQDVTTTAAATTTVTTGTSSFFNTCFNGLNALSVIIIVLSKSHK
ncbi:hypothetical protein Hdeb2414_s0006g00206561 [Helianthus debilis subsp. tardiflorus]